MPLSKCTVSSLSRVPGAICPLSAFRRGNTTTPSRNLKPLPEPRLSNLQLSPSRSNGSKDGVTKSNFGRLKGSSIPSSSRNPTTGEVLPAIKWLAYSLLLLQFLGYLGMADVPPLIEIRVSPTSPRSTGTQIVIITGILLIHRKLEQESEILKKNEDENEER